MVSLENIQEYLDILWILICTMLVLLMQPGFCCLESGMVRAKNSIHVAIKNLSDFCIAALLFWVAGFAIMFGDSVGGVIGHTGFFFGQDTTTFMYAFFLFQLAFCATATTIVSGAVAERMRFSGYILTSAILSGLIYPVAGHWAWGGYLPNTGLGWLSEKGFIDFAGSTVVHSVGGWIALAALIVIGPRIGRFGKNGRHIEGHNLTTSTLGVFLLWVGWFGFNGGSRLALDEDVPLLLVNTAMSGAAGGLGALLYTWTFYKKPDVIMIFNGVLAGLVSVSASCHILTPFSSLLVGAIGGFICVWGSNFLERRKIDDAIGVVPVHLFAGIWGTLAVSLFADPDTYFQSFLDQLQVQILGVAAIGLYSFGVGYILLSLIDRFFTLRTSIENEKIGLNVAEHGSSTALYNLLQEMENQRFEGDFSSPVDVEPGTDAGKIAMQYNLVLDKFNSETKRRESAVRAMRRARDAAEAASRTKSRFLANVSHELRTPLGGIISYSEAIKSKIFGPIGSNKYEEYVDTIYESGNHLLSLINDLLDLSKIEASRFDLNETIIDLNQMADDMFKIVEPKSDKKNLKISKEYAKVLPQIYGDRRAIKQILLNIYSNAIKFTPDGGKITIATNLLESGDVSVSVSDTGKGISQEDMQKVMEPFIQTESGISSEEKGTGLGLPLAKSLIELHSGKLEITSEPNVGTTVTVHFPETRVQKESDLSADNDDTPTSEAAE